LVSRVFLREILEVQLIATAQALRGLSARVVKVDGEWATGAHVEQVAASRLVDGGLDTEAHGNDLAYDLILVVQQRLETLVGCGEGVRRAFLALFHGGSDAVTDQQFSQLVVAAQRLELLLLVVARHTCQRLTALLVEVFEMFPQWFLVDDDAWLREHAYDLVDGPDLMRGEPLPEPFPDHPRDAYVVEAVPAQRRRLHERQVLQTAALERLQLGALGRQPEFIRERLKAGMQEAPPPRHGHGAEDELG